MKQKCWSHRWSYLNPLEGYYCLWDLCRLMLHKPPDVTAMYMGEHQKAKSWNTIYEIEKADESTSFVGDPLQQSFAAWVESDWCNNPLDETPNGFDELNSLL